MTTATVNTARMLFNPSTNPDPEEEEWRWVPGFEQHYAVSSRGRIRSHKIHPRGRIIKLVPGSKSGRWHPEAGLTWTPMMNGHRTGMTVSRAVALAFHGPQPEEGMVARHITKDVQDNRPANIEWRF